MKTTNSYRLLLLLLLMMAGAGDALALWRNDITFTPINRTSQSDNTITSAHNAGNQYALAIADMSELPGIKSAGFLTFYFDIYFEVGSRWQIGIGNKDIRGTNANGSSKSSYNSTGLLMQIGDDNGYFRVKVGGYNQNGTNNSSAYNDAFGRPVRVYLEFNRNAGTFNYSLTDIWNNTVYFTGTGITAPVDYVTMIEAYTWANNASIIISNVTVNYNFFFEKSDETIYVEDLVYYNPLNNDQNRPNVNIIVDNSYLRRNNDNYYPIKTTGSQPSSLSEGDYTTVVATATEANNARFRVRIKTRNELDPNSMVTAATNTFDVGSTLGLFTSQVVYLDGLTLYLGYYGHTAVVRSINGDYGLTIIDSNGYAFGNYDQGHEWGTVYKVTTTQAKKLTVSGYFSATTANAVQLYDGNAVAISGKIIPNPGDGSLASATFDLDAGRTYYLYSPGWDVFALKSLSYRSAYFNQTYAVTTIGSTYRQTAHNMANPVYSIISKEGSIASTGVTINSSTGEVSNITAGGALKIQAAGSGLTCYYSLTVAYPATEYPGHQWNFCTDVDDDGNEISRDLDVSNNLKTIPTPVSTTTDSYGEEWRAENKYGNVGGRPSTRWYRTRAVNGDNAFIVKETNGLVFVTDEHNFYLRNDAAEFSHIGIRGLGASFTIPALESGDIIEIMWRHDTSVSGSTFTASNVTDLRGKDVSEEFTITESARRGNSNTRFVGYYSFIAKGGDATFFLADDGNCDIQSIRIYKGPYRSTMRNINLSGNSAAPTTMLLDNTEQTYTFNYCNQLYSTATGPAMYVLKGYRKNTGSGTLGVDYDHPGCVTGANAARSPEFFTDEEGYPISDEEKKQLYELRKNIVGLQMYNDTWQSSNNSYNNGIIKATSGWGKITIRMNNYTNDMKYLIGYTPDYTLNIGSAPHQTYPYTWDFTKIAGGTTTGRSDNVLNCIEAEGSNSDFSGTYPTNWLKKGNGQFMLNTDNRSDLGSQYVPGAVLVTQDRALSNFNGVNYEGKYALDELDGLGFAGDIAMNIDRQPSDVTSGWNRAYVEDVRNSMLSFRLTDFATFEKTGGTDEEPIGAWHYSKDEQAAGNGIIQLNHIDDNNHINESSIPAGGIGFRLDGGNTKYIHVIPVSTLQPGDIISVTAYNAYNNRDAGICFNRTASSSDVAQYRMLNNRMVEETIDYTVVSNDGLDGRNDFYLYMYSNTVHITAIEITRSASAVPNMEWSIYTLSNMTITVPDLNANGKQDWIYVSASSEPESVTNATKVTNAASGGADGNTNVYKYKVAAAGDVKLTFDEGIRIYKIGVTHILKEIHPVGSTGWATESRDHAIDHELTGYFTINDANAYTVCYDSYDLNTATVALTPINENGFVPAATGIVMKLDNNSGLTNANDGKNVPLFYPSYTRDATIIANDNMMIPVIVGGRQWFEVNTEGKQKFILTNVHWCYSSTDGWGTQIIETDAAGFYRLHIWGDETRDRLPDNCAYLGVSEDELPIAVWNTTAGSRREGTLGIRELDDETTRITHIMPPNDNGDIKSNCSSPYYTLDGRKHPHTPDKAGLYISRGQKVIIK